MRMICPLMPNARGIQIDSPNDRETRSATLVLPLPGWPNRNMPRPEFTAGPNVCINESSNCKSWNARFRSAALMRCSETLCALTEAVYCDSVTGVAPKYVQSREDYFAIDMPFSVTTYV